jgi:uncharacterized membrane protein (DUF106 family)
MIVVKFILFYGKLHICNYTLACQSDMCNIQCSFLILNIWYNPTTFIESSPVAGFLFWFQICSFYSNCFLNKVYYAKTPNMDDNSSGCLKMLVVALDNSKQCQ